MGVDTRNVPRDEILAALDEVGIADTWAPAGLLRGGLLGDGSNLGDLPRKAKLNAGFRNQVVGRIAERVFRLRHLSRLEPRFTIHDYHARGDNRDYGIANERVELPVNVKVASTLFRNARMFGLEPEDCIPISSYKALNAIRAVPDLVYVDLVDFRCSAGGAGTGPSCSSSIPTGPLRRSRASPGRTSGRFTGRTVGFGPSR